MDSDLLKKLEGEEPEGGYIDWGYDVASNVLDGVKTFLGWSTPTQQSQAQPQQLQNNNPEACQATGKPVCRCNKMKPK